MLTEGRLSAEERRRNLQVNDPGYRDVQTASETKDGYGKVPSIKVGHTWDTRHTGAGIVAGIHGAYSIVLSGGYEDDDDKGDEIIYTGTGGRNDRGLQVGHQTFEDAHNYSLKLSLDSRQPVRVVRGSDCHSKYAPKSGYRYDGLYTVTKAELVTGKREFKICQFTLVRNDGQPPIPERQKD